MNWKHCGAEAARALVAGVFGALFAVALAEPRLDGVSYADFGISATVVVVASILSSLFGLFGGRVEGNVKRALEGMRDVVTNLGRELVNTATTLGSAIAAALGVLKRALERWGREIIRVLRDWWKRLIAMLDKVFGPIIDFLRRLKDEIKDIYKKFVKPIVDTIEVMRRVLRLLQVFDIDWAKKLDQKLQEIITYVQLPFEWVERRLVWLEDWVRRIVTVDGLVQRIALVGALWRDHSYWITQWWAGMHKPLDAGKRVIYEAPSETLSPAEQLRPLAEYLRTRDGPLAARISEFQANVKLAAAAARGV